MGKRYNAAKEKVETRSYGLDEAFKLIPELSGTKFDASVDVAARLGVDPRKAEQMVRSTVILPNGTGKDVRVLVFAKGEKETEAKEAGADFIGAEDLVEKIKGGWFDFDKIVATPDMMALVGKIGKLLGPRGLMPNPKLGTVTQDVKKAVTDLKAGMVEFRVDKAGNVHAPLGRVSFGEQKLRENFDAVMGALMKAKPTASKGVYLKNISVSSTMGPAVKFDTIEVRNTFK
ncbi:MAG: 50S ribosomal protein L1 [Deltaproteobacteria bacterium]|nr:50S ribosomal protein L1 [Deltaproteobacteria bacterium]